MHNIGHRGPQLKGCKGEQVHSLEVLSMWYTVQRAQSKAVDVHRDVVQKCTARCTAQAFCSSGSNGAECHVHSSGTNPHPVSLAACSRGDIPVAWDPCGWMLAARGHCYCSGVTMALELKAPQPQGAHCQAWGQQRGTARAEEG